MTLTLTETEAPPILEVHQRAEALEAEALMEETTPATALAQVRVAEAQAVEEVQTEKELQLGAAEDQVATQVQTEEELQVGITAAAADGQMEIRLEFLLTPCLTFSLSPQGFPFSGVGNQRRQLVGGRGQQGRRTGGQSPVAQNTATRRIPPSRNPPRAFPPRINTPKSPSTKFVSSGNQNLLAQVFGESTETERPRLPAKPSQFVPRPSAGRRRPRPGSSNNVRARPAIGQQQSTTRKFSGGSTRKSLSGQGSSRTRGSTSRSEASSSGTKGVWVKRDSNENIEGDHFSDIKPTDLYPLAGYKNTAGNPFLHKPKEKQDIINKHCKTLHIKNGDKIMIF